MRKSKTTKNFNNYKMTPEVYKLKRKVINILYELKDKGFNIPRIDVRIGQHKDCQVLGVARLNNNIIWITENAIDKKENEFYHTVLHELLHTIYGCEHDNKCHIMSTYQPKIVYSKNKLLKIFKNYYNKYNNITTKQLEVA
tara:strand:+ start:145 stop:567 length:423 start_codon:yes stop_codon:yes gene_type:complete